MKYVFGVSVGRKYKMMSGCGADSVLAMHIDDTLYFALSDGAGSSALSHRVSDAVVYESIRLMISGMDPRDVPHVLSMLIKEIFMGIDRRDLYATLAIGTYKDGQVTYVTVGDSVILYRKDGRWYATEVVKGEFANETVFLLSEGWKDMVKKGQVEGVDAIVVSSDGLAGAYFYYRMSGDHWYVEPSGAFLDKLVDAVETGKLSYDNITKLLSSEKLMDINDDDKSVVIASARL